MVSAFRAFVLGGPGREHSRFEREEHDVAARGHSERLAIVRLFHARDGLISNIQLVYLLQGPKIPPSGTRWRSGVGPPERCDPNEMRRRLTGSSDPRPSTHNTASPRQIALS